MVSRLELLDLQVMRVMTGLKQLPERALSVQLRANGVRITSREHLRSSLRRLKDLQVLRHDVEAKIWVVQFDEAKRWCREIREQEKVRASLLSNIEDHVQLGGSPIYRWVNEAKMPRRK